MPYKQVTTNKNLNYQSMQTMTPVKTTKDNGFPKVNKIHFTYANLLLVSQCVFNDPEWKSNGIEMRMNQDKESEQLESFPLMLFTELFFLNQIQQEMKSFGKFVESKLREIETITLPNQP